MASRQFLKILQSARFGDVSAQQNLASAYLTGAFSTPIQPANSLVWLEKSYFSITNQLVADTSSDDDSDLAFSDSLTPIFSLLSTIPLANTVGSPAFPFGWKLFWKLADVSPSSDAASSPLSQAALNARWQLIQFLLSPEYADEQARLRDWLASSDAGEIDSLPTADIPALQQVCKTYLQSLAETENTFTQAAKELLLRLQPKDETLSGLWAHWLASGKQEHLLEAAEMGLTIARLTLGLQLAQLDAVSGSAHATSVASGAAEVDKVRSNASLKKAVYWLELVCLQPIHRCEGPWSSKVDPSAPRSSYPRQICGRQKRQQETAGRGQGTTHVFNLDIQGEFPVPTEASAQDPYTAIFGRYASGEPGHRTKA
jgi:hypothetical protein